ncbi:MAG: ATP-binding cassette domain-containing protein [Pseudomonadota bacterium]
MLNATPLYEKHEPEGSVSCLCKDDAELLVSNIAKTYKGSDKPILNGASFAVAHGEAVALMGANGAGKSTLMRCCMGLVPFDQGTVSVLKQSINDLSPKALRQLRAKCGFVFQKHNLVPRLSALSNVIHGCQSREQGMRTWHQAIAKNAIRQQAMHYLDMVGLADYALRRVDQLSGGQSQRVAIARTLMQKPILVFADEPVASLDPNAGEDVMALFVSLIKEHNLTLLFSSHHISHALTYSDRVIGLHSGQVVLDQAVHRLNEDKLRGLYEQ